MVVKKIIEKTQTFRQEYRKQMGTAIITAFGLIIALSWKDVITYFVGKLNPVSGLISSAIIVTIISVLGILLVNKWVNKN